MRDSAFKRIFWMIVFGMLLLGLIYGSFFWSLEQTIRITNLIVEEGWPGIVFGIIVQFSPTAFLYMASSFNPNDKKEQNQRMMWLAAFWGMSLFDGFTNLGARLDRISMDTTPPLGFTNPTYAVAAEWVAIGLGVILDFAIVFAEELLGHIISVFFDNLSALIILLGGDPPKWLAMASGIGRAVGGQNMKNQQPNRPGPGAPQDHKNKGKGNRPDNRPGRPEIDPNRMRPDVRDVREERQPPRDPRQIPLNTRGDKRPPISIRRGDE